MSFKYKASCPLHYYQDLYMNQMTLTYAIFLRTVFMLTMGELSSSNVPAIFTKSTLRPIRSSSPHQPRLLLDRLQINPTNDPSYTNLYAKYSSNCLGKNAELINDSYYSIHQCINDVPTLLPPPCISNVSQLAFEQGSFSAQKTFYTCLENVADSAELPSFYNGTYHGCLVILAAITLLNLVKVDEIDGTSTLQIMVDYQWVDNRYSMPLFWNYVNWSWSGFDLTYILANESVVMWIPEVLFPDASELSIQSSTLNIREENLFTYEVVYELVLVQPQFNFRKYPFDTQYLTIRFAVVNYDAYQLQIYPQGIYCSYLQDNTCSFSHNAIWTWDESFLQCSIYCDRKLSAVEQIWPAYVDHRISITRQGSGVTFRLILPLTFLLLLSGLTFWSSYGVRVDTTITILFAFSAMYIVILQNIPQTGYLTNVDKFVFWMLLLLCLVVALHQASATVREKVERWPLRLVYIRIIELIGRAAVIPSIVGFFVSTVYIDSREFQITLILVSALGGAFILFRECFGVVASFHTSLELLVEKVNASDLTVKDVSDPEMIVLNYYLYGKVSKSRMYLARDLGDKGKIVLETKIRLNIRNMLSFQDLLSGAATSNNDYASKQFVTRRVRDQVVAMENGMLGSVEMHSREVGQVFHRSSGRTSKTEELFNTWFGSNKRNAKTSGEAKNPMQSTQMDHAEMS